MIIPFTADEVFRIEDTLRGVELPNDDRQPYMLSAEEWKDAMLKVGSALGDSSYIGLTEHECWALIRLLSVYDQIGFAIKVKLYAALNSADIDFLTTITTAEEHEYASQDPSESAATSEGFANAHPD